MLDQPVILEVAILDVKAGHEAAFERDFAAASKFISSAEGYVSHQLQRCAERPNRYLLLAKWKSLEAHTEGFRKSPQYAEWKKLLHHYYDPFPTVEHYELIYERAKSATPEAVAVSELVRIPVPPTRPEKGRASDP